MHPPARVAAVAASMTLAAGQCLLWTEPAAAGVPSAGQVIAVGSTLQYTGYPGIGNDVDVSPNGLKIDIDDQAGPIDIVGPQCVPSPEFGKPYQVSCDRAGMTAIALYGGDLSDTLYVRDPMSAHLFGGSGNDSLTGGPGDDLLVGGGGADEMSGGLGIDTVSYAGYLVAVTADADGVAGDDGAPGEGDTIQPDVEQVVGGNGGDLLMGTASDETLRGGPGSDRILGNAGEDRLYGDAGLDLLDGGTAPPGFREWDVCALGQEGGTALNCEVILE